MPNSDHFIIILTIECRNPMNYDARGDYETALNYLKQSLAIAQQIGDKSGECVTTINLGHIHWQNDDQKSAMKCWSEAYLIAKKMNHAQALDALESIAEQLDLDGGLAGWEKLLN